MPRTNLQALLIERFMFGVVGLEEEVRAYRQRYVEREDMPGANLLARMLQVLVSELAMQVVVAARRISLDNPNGPQQPIPPLPNENTPLDGRLNQLAQRVRAFEAEARNKFELLAYPHGPSFAPAAQAYRQLLSRLPITEDAELLFAPVVAHEYRIRFAVKNQLRTHASALNQDLEPFFDTLPRLIAITYPRAFEDDVFQHAIIAHEAAHYALQVHGRGDGIWLETLANIAGAGGLRLDLKPYFIEMACDLLATRMIGPVFYLALLDYTLAGNVAGHPPGAPGSESHPGAAWRFARLDAECDRYLGARPADAQPEAWDAMQSVIDDARQVVTEFPQPNMRDEALIHAALDQVGAEAGALLADAGYRVEQFAADLGPAWDKLSRDIPPAEAVYGRDLAGPIARPKGPGQWSLPLDWRSALNASYAFWSTGEPELALPLLLADGEKSALRRRKACEYIQGTIELTALHDAMRDLSSQLAGLEPSQ